MNFLVYNCCVHFKFAAPQLCMWFACSRYVSWCFLTTLKRCFFLQALLSPHRLFFSLFVGLVTLPLRYYLYHHSFLALMCGILLPNNLKTRQAPRGEWRVAPSLPLCSLCCSLFSLTYPLNSREEIKQAITRVLVDRDKFINDKFVVFVAIQVYDFNNTGGRQNLYLYTIETQIFQVNSSLRGMGKNERYFCSQMISKQNIETWHSVQLTQRPSSLVGRAHHHQAPQQIRLKCPLLITCSLW